MIGMITLITNPLISEINPSGKLIKNKDVLASLLPKKVELSDWENSAEPQYFEPGNLWEYINGQAELYLQYGFQLVVT